MSNDPTRDIDEKYTTQPTIQTVLERLDDFRGFVEINFAAIASRMSSFENRMDSLESRMSSLEVETKRISEEVRSLSIRFDRITSVAHDARAEVREMEDRVRELENK